MKKIHKYPLLFFYFLIAYIFIQFYWWGYLIYDLNNRIFFLQKTSIKPENIELINQKISHQSIMIFTEGFVFIIILLIISYQVRKSFKTSIELADQQKNFLHSVTHELNSPITSMKLYIDTLINHKIKEKDQNLILQNTKKECDRLQNLVKNILTAVQLDRFNFTLYFEMFSLSKFLEQIVQKEKIKNVTTIESSIAPNLEILTDKMVIEVIINNLIDNAIKYSKPTPIIQILAYEKENKIQIEISDNGCGISEEDKKKIFEKFYRVGNEKTRKTKGTGLGLYIVKELVLKLKGEIIVKDNSEKGTIFHINLPIGNKYSK